MFLRVLVISLLVVVVSTCGSPPAERSEAGPKDESVKKKVSGAYEALTWLAESRAYPNEKLPASSYYEGWLEAQSKFEDEQAKSDMQPWASMGPHNRAGRMLAIAFNPQNPNTILAGSASGGLWRSYTAGAGVAAWERVETGFPALGVSCVNYAPGDSTTIYIGTGEVYNGGGVGNGAAFRSARGTYGIGILKSTDGGDTWQPSLDWTLDQNRGVWSVEVDPTNADIVMAATTEGVFRSEDAGETWAQTLDVSMVMDLIIHPTNSSLMLAACGNFNSLGKGIYRSANGGVTWTQILDSDFPSSFAGKIDMAFAPSDPDIVYASIGNGFTPFSPDNATWLLRSENFGQDWELRTTTDYSRWQGWFSHDVAVSPIDPDFIICTGIEVWRSFDGGLSLDPVSVGGTGFSNPDIGGPDGIPEYVHSDAHDVIFHPVDGNRLFIASDGGISESIDGGTTFIGRNGQLQTTQFYNGFSNSYQDSTLALGGLQDNNTIIWQGDKRWATRVGGDGSWTGINFTNDQIIYGSSQGLRISRSDDRGESFFGIFALEGEAAAFIAPYVVAQNNSNILYAGAQRVHKSENGGFTWFVPNENALDGNVVLSMATAATNDEVVYAATAPLVQDPSIYVSTDGAVTWTNITGNLPNRFPNDLTVDPNDAATAYVVYSGFGTGHVFKTTDFGQSWTDITQDLPDVPTNAVVVDPLDSDHIYLGNDIGVFSSIDGGESWSAFQDGLPAAVLVFDLTISPVNQKLRVATHGNGAYERDLISQQPSSSNEIANAEAFGLELFPNPVANQLNVLLNLETSQVGTIRVYDAVGRQIWETRNGFDFVQSQQAIDVSDWQAGVYYLRMQVGTDVATQRFIVE
ncbi:MAG: T9SS type A sorting domain-containing protein [Bacteroidota bacterium]